MRQLVVLAGGAAGARQIQKQVRRAQREQVRFALFQPPLEALCSTYSISLTVYHTKYKTHVPAAPVSEVSLPAGMQVALCAEIDQSSRNGAGKGKKNKVAVDSEFFQRTGTILGMCVNHTDAHILRCMVELWCQLETPTPHL